MFKKAGRDPHGRKQRGQQGRQPTRRCGRGKLQQQQQEAKNGDGDGTGTGTLVVSAVAAFIGLLALLPMCWSRSRNRADCRRCKHYGVCELDPNTCGGPYLP